MQHKSQKVNLVLFVTFVAVTPSLDRYTLMASSLTLMLGLVIISLYLRALLLYTKAETTEGLIVRRNLVRSMPID